MLDITQHRTAEQWEAEAERLMIAALSLNNTHLTRKQAVQLYGYCIKNAELAERGLIPTVNVITDMDNPAITYPVLAYSLDFEGRVSRPIDGMANTHDELMAIISYYLPNNSKTCVVNGVFTIDIS